MNWGVITNVELLEKVYNNLFLEQSREVELLESTYIFVKDFNVRCSGENGFLRYDKGKNVKIDGVEWLISRGVPHGDTKPYLGDIRAARLKDPKKHKMPRSEKSIFGNSLIIATEKGNLEFPGRPEFNGPLDELGELLLARVGKHTSEKGWEDLKVKFYTPEAVSILTSEFEEFLKRESSY